MTTFCDWLQKEKPWADVSPTEVTELARDIAYGCTLKYKHGKFQTNALLSEHDLLVCWLDAHHSDSFAAFGVLWKAYVRWLDAGWPGSPVPIHADWRREPEREVAGERVIEPPKTLPKPTQADLDL